MERRRIAAMLPSVAVVALLSQGCARVVTTGSLLKEMTDLRRLAELPKPAYVTTQASSYDRKSTDPAVLTPENWFANGDFGQFIRTEQRAGRTEHVMMEADGPGAIVRIWSANPKGTLRIYLDGADNPVIEAPMSDLLGGKVSGLPAPIAGERSRGWNLYFPIPYALRCKVTSDEKGFYYHVNYRTYPAGTSVESFDREDLDRLAGQIAKVANTLAAPRSALTVSPMAAKVTFSESLAAGGEATLAKFSGPRAIDAFEVHLSASDMVAAARGIVLHITFNGEKTVESPLGDFFGAAPGVIPYESLPMGMVEGQPAVLWCHWFMPFSKEATVTVKNLGQQPAQLKGELTTVPYLWTDRSMLFHAKWRIERDLPTRPFTDWSHLECKGQGRFVGGSLHVINWVRNWWGEGDEKIYVDGEKFPSHFGTGSEDYYGYAWCCSDRFVHAYHNQPKCEGPNNYGNTSVNRFHIIDDIPFCRQFKFAMENWHSHPHSRTTRAAVSYWYARPGGSDFFKSITPHDVVPTVVPAYHVSTVPGVIEGEKLKILERQGRARPQDLGEPYSDGTHLWWTDNKPGNRLVLGFDVAEAGSKHVIVRLVKANDYGQVQFYVNDQRAGEVIDLFSPDIVPLTEIDLGSFDLKAGQNRLTIEMVGANAQAIKSYMFGLDYIKVK